MHLLQLLLLQDTEVLLHAGLEGHGVLCCIDTLLLHLLLHKLLGLRHVEHLGHDLLGLLDLVVRLGQQLKFLLAMLLSQDVDWLLHCTHLLGSFKHLKLLGVKQKIRFLQRRLLLRLRGF